MKHSDIEQIAIVYGKKDLVEYFVEQFNIDRLHYEEEKEQINKNIKLANKLISFCVRHFNDYSPKPK